MFVKFVVPAALCNYYNQVVIDMGSTEFTY